MLIRFSSRALFPKDSTCLGLDRLYSSPDSSWPYLFNFGTIDGDHFAAYPGINRNGRFELFGDDSNYLCDMDADATEHAYRVARQARFEFGETPQIGRA